MAKSAPEKNEFELLVHGKIFLNQRCVSEQHNFYVNILKLLDVS